MKHLTLIVLGLISFATACSNVQGSPATTTSAIQEKPVFVLSGSKGLPVFNLLVTLKIPVGGQYLKVRKASIYNILCTSGVLQNVSTADSAYIKNCSLELADGTKLALDRARSNALTTGLVDLVGIKSSTPAPLRTYRLTSLECTSESRDDTESHYVTCTVTR